MKWQWLVLILESLPDGTTRVIDRVDRASERACYKHIRFIHATNPTARCEIYSKGPASDWAKVCEVKRTFAPGDKIHAMHVEAGMFVTDGLYLFEAKRAGDLVPSCTQPEAAVLVCLYVLPPRPGVKQGHMERKVQPGDIVTEHWTLDFINVGSRERADALMQEATLAWQAAKDSPITPEPTRRSTAVLLASLGSLTLPR